MSANKIDSGKPKRKAPPSAWKKGQSGNPKGRPKDGQSWQGILREITNMTAEELLEVTGERGDLGSEIKKFPKGVPMKKLLAARLITALMFDPTGSLFNVLMDREEGKVQETLDVTSGGKKIVVSLKSDDR